MNRRSGWRRGHVGGFNDPLMDCKACKARFRADKLIEDWAKANGEEIEADGWTNEQLESFIEEKQYCLPDLRQARFHRHPQVQHDVQDPSGRNGGREQRDLSASGDRAGHFRQLPERRSAPPAESCRSAYARWARSFRNEITPGNFIFRIREFEQMELEFFCKPGTDLEWFSYWRSYCHEWLLESGHQGRASASARPQAGRAGALFQGDDRLRVSLPVRLG